MSYSQLNKLKGGIKNDTELMWSVIIISHQLVLTDTQISIIRKAFANVSSADIKSSKTQLSKMIQSGGVTFDIPIFGSILSNLAKKEQILLEIQDKIFWIS